MSVLAICNCHDGMIWSGTVWHGHRHWRYLMQLCMYVVSNNKMLMNVIDEFAFDDSFSFYVKYEL